MTDYGALKLDWKPGDPAHDKEHNKLSTRLMDVREFGAKADGSTDNAAALKTAIAALPAGSRLSFPPGDYITTDGLKINKAVSLHCTGGRARIIQTGTTYATSSTLLNYVSPITATYTASGTLAAKDNALTLNSVSGLSVGQEVFLELGVAKYDATQPYLSIFRTILAINGLTVTFRTPFGETINGTSNKLLVLDVIENVSIEGVSLIADAAATPDQVIIFTRCRNVSVHNLHMNHTGSIVNDRSSNVTLDNIYVKRARRYGNYGASGNVIGGWGFHNYTIKNLYCEEVDANGIYLEAQGRGFTVDNYWYTAGASHGTNGYGIWVGGNCRGGIIRNAHLNAPYDNYFGIDIAEEAGVTTEGIHLYSGTRGVHFIKNHRGALGWDMDTGTMAEYGENRTKVITVLLTANMSKQIPIPSGIYKHVEAFTDSAETITSLNFVNGGDMASLLVTNQTVSFDDGRLTHLGPTSAYPFNNALAKTLFLTTGANVPAGATLVLTVDYIQ